VTATEPEAPPRRRFGRARVRAVAFGLVGLSGVLPNLAVLQLLTVVGLHYAPATVIATQVAILWNFALLDRFVYGTRRHRRTAARLGRFLLLNNADLAIRIPLLALLIEHARLSVLPATCVTLLLASVVRFVATDRLIYSRHFRLRAWPAARLRPAARLPHPRPEPPAPGDRAEAP
jgi:dolichol-phosphate mannosyltransferase